MKTEQWDNHNQPEIDAFKCVQRYSDTAIVTPHYTRSALEQGGWQLSKGLSRLYRERFTKAYVDAWIGRYEALTGKTVL